MNTSLAHWRHPHAERETESLIRNPPRFQGRPNPPVERDGPYGQRMPTNWRQSAPGRYIDLEWRNGSIYLEDGPDVWPKRGHEGTGGTVTLAEIRRRGRDMFSSYDGLYGRLLEDLEPWIRVSDAPRGVVVMLDDDLGPCPTPCRFTCDGDRVYVFPATVEPSEQLVTTPQAALVVTGPGDGRPGMDPTWWSRIHGPASLVDDPEWELGRAAELFSEKYGVAAADPAEVPIIRIDIEQWTTHSFPD